MTKHKQIKAVTMLLSISFLTNSFAPVFATTVIEQTESEQQELDITEVESSNELEVEHSDDERLEEIAEEIEIEEDQIEENVIEVEPTLEESLVEPVEEMTEDESEEVDLEADLESESEEVIEEEIKYDQEAIHDLAMQIMAEDIQTKNSRARIRTFSSGIAYVDAFLDNIIPAAIESSVDSKILPSIMMAQAALESAWGLSGLAQDANNLFGIKSSNDWKGQIYQAYTKEFVNGKWITTLADFRKYNNWLESINDHAAFFTSTEWRKENYKHVVGEKDYRKAAQALSDAGYATDPDYPGKLISIIETYNLAKYDNVPVLTTEYHMQKFGWITKRGSNLTLGHVGDNLRMEDLKVSFPDDSNLSITYSAHIQKTGWVNNIKEGNSTGNTGKGLRMEAIKMNLAGATANSYDIFYRTYTEAIGWSGWAKNGEAAGTEGYGKKIQSIEIKLAWKGDNPVDTSKTSFKVFTNPQVSYSTQLQYDGWTSYVQNGALSGTLGKARRLEAIKITLPSIPYEGGIQYQAHAQTYGWLSKVSNNQISGTVGEAKRLEAVKINLTGEMANQYDIYYRTHIQTYGWTGWAKNGSPSGSEGLAKRLEAIQIKLVKKGEKAPGTTTNSFYR